MQIVKGPWGLESGGHEWWLMKELEGRLQAINGGRNCRERNEGVQVQAS
jgi:hypothetical protein